MSLKIEFDTPVEPVCTVRLTAAELRHLYWSLSADTLEDNADQACILAASAQLIVEEFDRAIEEAADAAGIRLDLFSE